MSNAAHKTQKSLDRLRKRKKPASQRVGIVMDSRWAARIDEAQRRVNQLEAKKSLGRNGDRDIEAELVDARDELEAAQKDALDETEWFVAKALAPRVFDALVAAHPPTKDQKASARKENVSAQWNLDTFPPALIAECVYLVDSLDEPDPDTGDMERHEPLTAEFVTEMLDGGQWNQGEVVALFSAALQANQAQPQRVSQLGNG